MSIQSADIISPKRGTDETKEREGRLFPYYAGYSAHFTRRLLGTLQLPAGSVVLDPWNGSGTTTSIAAEAAHRSVGCDLNPAMGLIARGDLVSSLEAPAIVPLATEIGVRGLEQVADCVEPLDPLCKWLAPSSAAVVRAIERQINKTLVSASTYTAISELRDFGSVSPIAAVMYTALFRTTRRLLHSFVGSNPTWIRVPRSSATRVRPAARSVVDAFEAEARLMSIQLTSRPDLAPNQAERVSLFRADSRSIPLADGEVDMVLTSPPYCTRIDYAVATSIELAVLNVNDVKFDSLRRELLGTSAIANVGTGVPGEDWGSLCTEFLSRLQAHPSVASSTYYYKNHYQYYDGLFKSIGEIARVVRPGGNVVLVVQDSFYKELHNDLAGVVVEMAGKFDMPLVRRCDFSAHHSMVNLNSRSRRYLLERKTTESVLCLVRAK